MSLSNTARILVSSPIFSSLTEPEVAELADLTHERSFSPNEFIFWEGDAPEWLYIVAEGKVKILKHSSLGREVILAFFGPGETFGDVAVFDNKPYPASAQATAETKVLGIKREDFLFFLARHPQIALRIINVLGGRLRESQSRLKDLAGERVEQRIANLLYMLYTKHGPTLPFTRQSIADMAGTTTETAIRIISQLKEREIIDSKRGKITILNKTKLRLLSEGPPQL